MTQYQPLINALRPITTRVRTDVSAVKVEDGSSRWTRVPITDETLSRHLNGGPARGVCPIKEGESVTMVGLYDLDSHGGESSWPDMVAVTQALFEKLIEHGMRPFAFRSSGGRGVHIYILFDQPQDAYSVRAFMSRILISLGYRNGTKGVVNKEIEIFPKQDRVDAGGFGNQFILPLAGKSEPLEPMLDFEPMGREYLTQFEMPTSPDVPKIDREVAVVGPSGGQSENPPDDLGKVREALFAIPNDGGTSSPDYDEWRNLCFAVHEATGGSDEGKALFTQWSEQNFKFDEQFFEQRVWPYVKAADQRTRGITRGTLYARAGMHGWTNSGPINTDGFEDVTDEEIEQVQALAVKEGGALLGKRRVALEQLRQQAEGVTDTIELKAKVGPLARQTLAAFPELRSEVINLLKGEAKALGSPLDAKDIRSLLSAPSTTQAPMVQVGRPLTEFGNAMRMLDRYGDGMMFVNETACWYLWNGNQWAAASQSEIEHCAKETVLELIRESVNVAQDRLPEFYEFCKASQRAIMVRNMVTLASSDPRVLTPAGELDKHPHLLGVKNGVVDLRTGALLAPDPAHRITITAGASYEPTAKCPLFQQTLLDVCSGDKDMAEYILTTFGYALCGEPVEDRMFIAFGDGSNGKSTIFNTVRKVFGAYAKTADASSFISDGKSGGNSGGAREDLVRLKGARFVYVNEPDENGELREGSVKAMTGGDEITARGLYAKKSMEIKPTWAVFMPTNHKPIIKGTDHGIWRRLDLLPFERNFDRDPNVVKDPGREEKLEAEMSGILTLLVKYAMRYKASGLVQPAKVKAARDTYRTNMDLLAEWLEECCEVGGTFEDTSQRLWNSWQNWATPRGLVNYIRNTVQLGRRLDQRFPAKKLPGGVRVRCGLRLRDDFA